MVLGNDTGSTAIVRNDEGRQHVIDNDDLTADWVAMFPAGPAPGTEGRVAAAFDVFDPAGNQVAAAPGTNVDALTPACRKLMDGIQDLLRYKEDAQKCEAALPQLIKMIKYEATVRAGATGIKEFADKESCRHALVQNGELCPAIVQCLSKQQPDDIAEALLETVDQMSKTDAGRRAIFSGLTIPMLVRMLGSVNVKLVQFALTTLHRLEHFLTDLVKEPIRSAGGVAKMTEVLVERRASPDKPWSNRFLAMLFDALNILCLGDNGSKTIFLSKGGLDALIDILNGFGQGQLTYEKLALTCVRTFCILSAYTTIKDKIIELGGMESASAVYHVPNEFTKPVCETALWALRNLSDKVDVNSDGDTMTNLMKSCLNVLSDQMSSDPLKECAVGILSNMTCNNATYKEVVIDNDGVGILIDTITRASGQLSIKEPAICALRHLTSRNQQAETARDIVGGSVILSLVKESLQMPQQLNEAHMGYVRGILSLIRNITKSPAARRIIEKEQLTERICRLLEDVDHLRRNDPTNPTIREFDLDGVIDGCVGSLHMFSLYKPLRGIISDLSTQKGTNMVVYIASFMASQKTSIQRECVGSLCELAQEPENKKILAEQHLGGFTIAQWLGNMLNSPVESIAAYAACTLYAIDEYINEDAPQTIERTIFLDESEVADQSHLYDNEDSPLIKSNGNSQQQQQQIGDTNV